MHIAENLELTNFIFSKNFKFSVIFLSNTYKARSKHLKKKFMTKKTFYNLYFIKKNIYYKQFKKSFKHFKNIKVKQFEHNYYKTLGKNIFY